VAKAKSCGVFGGADTVHGGAGFGEGWLPD